VLSASIGGELSASIVILGGGPAGAAAARLLALWGHDVRLITRPEPPAVGALAESLPPSCRKLFDVLAVRDVIETAGFVRATGNTVWWGAHEERVEQFADGERGWQVDSAELASLLLDAAERAGVSIERRRVGLDDCAAREDSIVLDCTGRSGVVARARGWRVYEPSLKTIALVGIWRRDKPWRVPDDTHTLIESYGDGWLWSVPLGSGRRCIAAMVDPRTSDLAEGAAREIYLSEIAKARRFASVVEGAVLEPGLRGWDASMYSSSRYADEHALLVGDAGSFIDPLSSAGVKKAIASGWLAAVAAHTAIERPGMRQIAFDFFAARERDIYRHLRALTQRFLADAATRHPDAFWADRSAAMDPPLPADEVDPPHIVHEFERLRAARTLSVRLGDGIRVEARPAVSGCEIVLEARIVDDAASAGVRYVRDIDVIALLDLAPHYGDVGELFDAYQRRAAPAALPDFLAALSAALAHGWLVWREGSA
jgi:flavin-dependent dehydrogenase